MDGCYDVAKMKMDNDLEQRGLERFRVDFGGRANRIADRL